ncbi:MAG: diaminopimelate epimerase [Neisseriaceae bacterium]|nr:diaminopimelate epimerase [Neisseriaceae bacterium]
MQTLQFTKMHGLGNDFMVIDGIHQPFDANAETISAWANRHTGVGFDQLLVVEQASDAAYDFRYRIFNADGSEVEQDGNGARCFFRFVREKNLTPKDEILVQTARGVIVLRQAENNGVVVNMGSPKFNPAEIPFIPDSSADKNRLTHIVVAGTLSIPLVCVNVGNPHAVVLVDDVANAPVAQWGAKIERHAQFPERVNVGFMQVLDRNHIRLRVFERGVGETLACGTGACAAVVAGVRLGLLDNAVTVSQTGGDLLIEWKDNQDILMTGPAETVFEGSITL